MECLVELEIVGKKMMVYGDGREIITIKVEEEKIRMRKAGFYEMLLMLRKELKIGVKVLETMTGLQSKHEILVDGLEIEEKIRGEDKRRRCNTKTEASAGNRRKSNVKPICDKRKRMASGAGGTGKKREIGYSTRIIGGNVCECTENSGNDRRLL